ncbi:SRPBCC family protein [Streptomyces sp. NPDC054956]
MTYHHSHTLEMPDVSPETIWEILSGPTEHHPAWDERVESVTLDGPFIDGTIQWIKFGFMPAPARTTLVDVIPGVGYSDDVSVNDVPSRFTHRIEPDGAGGCRVTFTIAMQEPSAEVVGADFPHQLAALASYARELSSARP